MFIDEKYMNDLLNTARHTRMLKSPGFWIRRTVLKALPIRRLRLLLMMEKPEQLERMFRLHIRLSSIFMETELLCLRPFMSATIV